MGKKIFATLIGLLFQFINLHSSDFQADFQILNIDFKGICCNNGTILIYGNFSSILISTDLGKTWKQSTIKGFSHSIDKIISFNNEFVGILDSGIIIKSKSGDNWEEIPTNIFEPIIDLCADNDFLCFINAAKNKIFIFDKNFSMIDEIIIPFAISDFIPTGNYFIIGNLSGKLYKYDRKKKELIDSVDLSSYGNFVHQFNSENNQIFFLVDDYLFSVDLDQFQPEYLTKLYAPNYLVKNGEIYSTAPLVTSIFNKLSANWIAFQMYDKTSKKLKTINNDSLTFLLDNVFLNTFLRQGPYKLTFVDDTTIFLVDKYRTILVSRNKGVNWHLLSFFDPDYSNFFCVKNYAFASKQRTIFRTTDFGLTWQPNQTTPEYVQVLNSILEPTNIFFDSNGKGFISNSLNYTYPDTSKNYYLLVSDDFGSTYRRGQNKFLQNLKSIENSFFEYFDIFRFKDKYGLRLYLSVNIGNPKYPLSLLVNFNDTSFAEESISSVKYFYDTAFRKIHLFNKDTAFAYFWSGVYSDTAYMMRTNITSWISFSVDGMNWNKLFDIEINEFPRVVLATPSGFIVFIHRDYIDLDFSVEKLYFVDIMHRNTKLLWQQILNEHPVYPLNLNVLNDFVVFHDRYEPDMFLCNLSVPNTTCEKTQFLKPIFDYFGDTIQISKFYFANDSIFYFSFPFNNYNNRIFVKATLKNNLPSIVQDRNSGDLSLNKLFVQTLPPFPQPATNFVKTRIYIEGFNEIKSFEFKLFDAFGNEVNTKVNVIVDKLTPFLFEANFDLGNLPNGLYFIRYQKNETIFCVPVIVHR